MRTIDPRRSKKRMRPRVWSVAALAVLLFLLAWALLPSGTAGPSGNRDRNGLWLHASWYLQPHTEAENMALAQRLTANGIRYAFVHVRSMDRNGHLRSHNAAVAKHLVAVLHHDAPGVKVLAWVYAGNTRARGAVNLNKPVVRSAMAREARWLTAGAGFDGMQWDYELCEDGNPGLPLLLRETRAQMPKGKILSVAVPMWLPRPFHEWGWSDAYFARISGLCDQMAVMAYDSMLPFPRAYAALVREQVIHVTRSAARGNPRCCVLIGVATYASAGWSHWAYSENVGTALRGVRAGLHETSTHQSAFEGVALFADYTTQPDEWETYRRLWRASTEKP